MQDFLLAPETAPEFALKITRQAYTGRFGLRAFTQKKGFVTDSDQLVEYLAVTQWLSAGLFILYFTVTNRNPEEQMQDEQKQPQKNY